MLPFLRRTFGAAAADPDPDDLVGLRVSIPVPEANAVGALLRSEGLAVWVTPTIPALGAAVPFERGRTTLFTARTRVTISVRRAQVETAERVLADVVPLEAE